MSVHHKDKSKTFEVEFEDIPQGYREMITVFGYVYINQVFLTSGYTFVVAKRNSKLFVAEQNSRVRDKVIITIDREQVNGNMLDTELQQNS